MQVSRKMNALSRILYLPMEIASREFDSRLLLAALALKRGFEVVLGQKWLIERNIAAMPAGYYLSKTLTQRDAKAMALAHQLGYVIGAIDEEMPGLVVSPEELRWISDESVAVTDRIFVSGEHNADSVRARFPQAADRIHAVMNPRWDLLRPGLRSFYDQQAAEIRQKFGPFILINTNLGLTNSEKGSAEEIIRDQERLGKLDLTIPSHVAFANGALAMETANRLSIINLIDQLPRRFPTRRIVLRPHPSERLDTWRQQVDGHAVVDVIRDGPAVPWILAADVLIHTNCTTGVEAAALDTPAICLLPTESPINDRYLSNRVNPIARSVEEVLDLIAVAESGGKPFYTQKMRDIFRRAMSYEDNRLGAECILDELDELGANHVSATKPRGKHSSWRPGRGYLWRLEDKNVRGSLFPHLDHIDLSNRLHAIGQALGLTIAPEIHDCGSKVMLISDRTLNFSTRIRQQVNGLLPVPKTRS
jgi:surface carbohydrate biosynthesis protein